MTWREFISVVALECDIPVSRAEPIVDAVVGRLVRVLIESGETPLLPGFGRIVVKTREARPGWNFWTGERVSVPAKRMVKVRASPQLEAALNPPADPPRRMVGSDRISP